MPPPAKRRTSQVRELRPSATMLGDRLQALLGDERQQFERAPVADASRRVPIG